MRSEEEDNGGKQSILILELVAYGFVKRSPLSGSVTSVVSGSILDGMMRMGFSTVLQQHSTKQDSYKRNIKNVYCKQSQEQLDTGIHAGKGADDVLASLYDRLVHRCLDVL